MAWNDNDGRDNKNPWGRGGKNGGGPQGPWGGQGGGGDDHPDLDEMLRRAQENLRHLFPGNFQGGKLFGLILMGIVLLWLASGFFIIEPGMHGVIQRFGAAERTQVEEGLGYHLPWPVETLNRVNVSEVRRMEIGFSDVYGRSNNSAKRDIPEESLMLTSDRNIVDIDLVVLWNIKDAEDYLFNIRDQENTIKKVAESAIREVVGQTRMFPIITQQRAEVAARAKEIMIKNLDDYQSGVNISQVLIQQAEVHPEVQDAFQDVQSAKQDAEDLQNRAQVYREDILPRARGQAIKMEQEAEAYKQSVISRAEGDAERFNKIREAHLQGEEVTRTRMYLETMENVLTNAEKIILDQNGGSGVVPYLPLNELRTNSQSSSSSQQSGSSSSSQR